LPEFAANNHSSELTNCSELFGNYGFHLWMTFGQHSIKDPHDIRQVNAQQMAQRMEQRFS
jgi:hypothetical protein